MVHGIEEYEAAVDASQILFGKGTKEQLQKMDEQTFFSVFEGVPQYRIAREILEKGIPIQDLLAVNTNILPSKTEARKMIQSGAISINKEKITSINEIIDVSYLLNQKNILIQKGKKNYYIILVD